MSAAPQPPDPFALLLTQFREGVRNELRAELRIALADLGQYLEPEYLDVKAAAKRAGSSETQMRLMLARHPEFKKTNGAAITVRWREFSSWYREQDHIPGDDRPRRPAPRAASRRKGGTGS